jgi:pre-mRNA-splicing factor SYF1
MHFILPEYLMQQEATKVSLEEAVDTLKRAGVPEDDMAALERQIAPAPLQDGMRSLGFVSGGVQAQREAGQVLGSPTRRAVVNPEEIEIGAESEEEEEAGAGVDVAEKTIPDAVYGELAGKARELAEEEKAGRGVQREREGDEVVGARERFKRQKASQAY